LNAPDRGKRGSQLTIARDINLLSAPVTWQSRRINALLF
jgi:hypothetical protein